MEQVDVMEECPEVGDGEKFGEERVHESPFPGSRLMIREMILENFKSYAGTKRIGPFHKCFSSVVGPNGSGKSNVIDAMLFVFGKRAKKLRLNKVSELIHKSTEHPNCESAKVTVCFQNIIGRDVADGDIDDEGYDVVEGSKLEISRVAYANNSSTYFVDGKKKTFKEVAQILETRGIDLQNNRFLILQGEVEQISLMKPKAPNAHEDGLLEYLEDIIGSNKYVEEIESSSKVVEELSQVRSEKLASVKIVEKEKDSLEDGKNTAEAYLNFKCQLLEKRVVKIQLSTRKYELELEKLNEKKAHAQTQLKEEEEKNGSASTERTALEERLKSVQKEYQDVLREVKSCQKAFSEFEKTDIKYQEDMKYAQETIKELDKNQIKQEKLHQKYLAAVEKLEGKTIPKLSAELEELEAKLSKEETALEKLYGSLSGETEKYRIELEAKQKDLAPLSEEVSQAKSKLDVARKEIELLERPVATGKAQLQEFKDKIEEAEIAVASRPAEIKIAEQDLANAETNLGTTQKALQECQTKEKDLESKVRVQRGKTETAKAAFAAASTRGTLLNALLQAKKTPGNPVNRAGLLGRLGDLGTIDAKYDVACSTAFGGLNNLVTETTKGAEICVKYLRDKQLGRATFSILEKFKNLDSRMKKKPKTPEGVPRLFDLVEVEDEKLLYAFYHAMGDTLVAEDLDQAVRIAYEGDRCKWKVVTLQGQVIDTSGTMAGGGNRVRRGLLKVRNSEASSKQAASDDVFTKDEIVKLEATGAELFSELKTCRENRVKLAREESRLVQRISDLRLMISKMKMEIGEMEKQRDQLKANLPSILAKCELSPEDISKLTKLGKESEALEKVYRKAQKRLDALEAETSALHEKIAQVGGPKVKAIKDTISSISESMDNNRKLLNKANNDVKNAKTKSKKALAAKQEAESEAEETRKRLETLKNEFKKVEDDALDVMREREACEKKSKHHKSEVEQAQRLLDDHKHKSKKTESRMVELKNELATYTEQDIPKKEEAIRRHHDQIETIIFDYKALIEQRGGHSNDTAVGEEEDVEEESGDQGEVIEKEEDVDEGDGQVPPSEIRLLSGEELDKLDVQPLNIEIDFLENEAKKLEKDVNLDAIKEYRACEEKYLKRVDDLESATKQRDSARETCEMLRKKRLDQFMAGFSQITLKLKEMYQMITLGGDATIELVDSCDPFSEGVIFSVRPPQKSWKEISNLSGGEKTLSSLALVFALHHYKPTPLYVLDEIDAALDFKNVSIIAHYIKERTKNAQFIIISLRNNMFELADRLVGIYKTHNATKSITINPAKIVNASKLQSAKKHVQTPSRPPLTVVNK
mmetsp:Transcript_10602/g.19885  ORF Transcript_10602/g.19885 Transcript_10602/m.19885 type:complete len:1329 (-) Transcript_10602:23-4009(-)